MKKPWNIPDLPVYSLATYESGKVNMNICTYVTAVSMKPKLYAVAVYKDTKTLQNIANNQFAVLQLLHTSHYNLVKKLGQTSGKVYDKEKYLHKKELLTKWEGYQIIKNIATSVLLKKVNQQLTGDHYLFVFETIKYKAYHTEYLTTGDLIKRKIVRM